MLAIRRLKARTRWATLLTKAGKGASRGTEAGTLPTWREAAGFE